MLRRVANPPDFCGYISNVDGGPFFKNIIPSARYESEWVLGSGGEIKHKAMSCHKVALKSYGVDNDMEQSALQRARKQV